MTPRLRAELGLLFMREADEAAPPLSRATDAQRAEAERLRGIGQELLRRAWREGYAGDPYADLARDRPRGGGVPGCRPHVRRSLAR